MDLFDVYVLRFDVSEERATRALMQVFGLSEAAARIFVHSVPRVGKRDVPTPMAERYVRALHAVGAVVECRRSGSAPLNDNARRVPQMSLPAPSDAAYAGVSSPPHIMQDSLGIMAPLAYAPDMPSIPKAPRIPADLHHIRARKGPDSMAPNWRATDSTRGLSASPLGALSADPGMWSAEPRVLQVSSDPVTELRAREAREPGDADGDGDDEPHGLPRSTDPDNDLLAQPSSPYRPLSPTPFAAASQPSRTQGDEDTPWYATTTHQLILAVAIIAGMGVALTTGVFETDVNRTSRDFAQAGIDPGTYEPAERYLSHPNSQFRTLPLAQLQTLIGRLSHAGAREIWVADIQQQEGARSASTLLVDLPQEAKARRAVFDELASAEPAGAQPPRPLEDTGQRFLRLEF
ncbi:MAG: hypothetical protein ABW321_19565 [Polyangiales bacterium]